VDSLILFYKYIPLDDPNAMMQWQRKLCTQLHLTGRIILAYEGINATLAGAPDHIETYKQQMAQHPLFDAIDFKEAYTPQGCFPRLQIKVKPEIVNLGIDPTRLSAHDGGIHLSPKEAHSLMQQEKKSLVILDARNNFESRIGKFNGAITPDINHFRELPAFIDQNKDLFEDKEVIMYCTGGIRCERASAYVKQTTKARAVYQITGGICHYVAEFPHGFFKGKNYVFDGRVSTTISNDVLTQCDLCSFSCDEYTHCLRASCNKQYIACIPCLSRLKNTCSVRCHEAVYTDNEPQRRAFIKKTL
jgi:predicted sulfurtransferase